jgi:hypothetical protein
MNERIRELAEQAGIAVWGDAVYMYHPDNTLDSTVMTKFAEFIVRECADVVKYYYIRGGEPITPQHITRHFGVEE